MNTSRIRLIIIFSVFVLIVLIRLVFSYTSSQSIQSTQTSSQIIITQAVIGGTRASNSRPTPTVTLAPAIAQANDARWNSIAGDKKARLEKFVSTMPYSSRDFDAIYDPQIHRIIFTIYSEYALPSIDTYLKNNNVYDIYSSGSSIFIVSKHPATTVVNQLRNAGMYEGDEKGK